MAGPPSASPVLGCRAIPRVCPDGIRFPALQRFSADHRGLTRSESRVGLSGTRNTRESPKYGPRYARRTLASNTPNTRIYVYHSQTLTLKATGKTLARSPGHSEPRRPPATASARPGRARASARRARTVSSPSHRRASLDDRGPSIRQPVQRLARSRARKYRRALRLAPKRPEGAPLGAVPARDRQTAGLACRLCVVLAFVRAGSNLRLEKKFLEMHYEMQMRSWTTDPEESDDDLDDDGATVAGGDEGGAAAAAAGPADQ